MRREINSGIFTLEFGSLIFKLVGLFNINIAPVGNFNSLDNFGKNDKRSVVIKVDSIRSSLESIHG